jgi:hypothetical protein
VDSTTSPLHTILAIPLAFLTWAIVYILAHVALYLLDSTRGLSDDWLQGIFRELFTPGVGGFAAMHCVANFLSRADLRVVAVVYCLPIVSFFLLFSIYMIVAYGSQVEFSWNEQILNWGVAISTCIGTYIGIKSVHS